MKKENEYVSFLNKMFLYKSNLNVVRTAAPQSNSGHDLQKLIEQKLIDLVFKP